MSQGNGGKSGMTPEQHTEVSDKECPDCGTKLKETVYASPPDGARRMYKCRDPDCNYRDSESAI